MVVSYEKITGCILFARCCLSYHGWRKIATSGGAKGKKCRDYGAFRGKNYEYAARVMSVFFACGASTGKGGTDMTDRLMALAAALMLEGYLTRRRLEGGR